MSLVFDNRNNFSLPVSPFDLTKLDAMRWDDQQLTLVVERTAFRRSDNAAFLHGKIVVLPRDQQIDSLNNEIARLKNDLVEQQKVIEDLKNILPDPPKAPKSKIKK